MLFDGFAGNQNARQQLSAYARASGRWPHALIIEGPQGSGKRTLARILARAAVCRAEGDAEIPCGTCPQCIKALSGNHPDIAEVYGDTEKSTFRVDTVRALRADAYIRPNEAQRRVVILVDTYTMTDQAQNALLKLMEEPPGSLMLILTCENRAQLLETVRSRAAFVSLGAVDMEEALPVVMRMCPDADTEQAIKALTVYGGIIGQAVQGLGDGTAAMSAELAALMSAAVAEPLESVLLRLTGRLEKNGSMIDAVLSAMTVIFRDALAILVNPDAPAMSVNPDTARLLSRKLPAHRLAALMYAVAELESARRRNMNPTLLLTLMCSRLRAAAGF